MEIDPSIKLTLKQNKPEQIENDAKIHIRKFVYDILAQLDVLDKNIRMHDAAYVLSDDLNIKTEALKNSIDDIEKSLNVISGLLDQANAAIEKCFNMYIGTEHLRHYLTNRMTDTGALRRMDMYMEDLKQHKKALGGI